MDILILTDDAQRASWYFDAAGRPTEDVLQELQDGIRHYFDTHPEDDDKLPENVCGAVCATMAAVILYGEVTAPPAADMQDVLNSYANLQESANFAHHAIEHNDAMAVEVFTPNDDPAETVQDVAARLTSWVLAHLPESDPDAFLASLSLEAEVSES